MCPAACLPPHSTPTLPVVPGGARIDPPRGGLARWLRRSVGALGILAISCAGILATPGTARADDTLIKLLLGATALAIVVHGVNSSKARPAQHHDPRLLPAQCRETLKVRGRHVDVYNARCLEQFRLHGLPQHCHETVRTNRGPHSIYRASCLEAAGFRREGAAPHAGQDRDRWQHSDRWQNRGRGYSTTRLPRRCAITYSYKGARHPGHDAACLSRAGLQDLPQSCIVRGSNNQIFSTVCLQGKGYHSR